MHSHRRARIWAGGAGLVGFLALILAVLLDGQCAAYILLGTWLATGLSYGVAHRVTRWRIHAMDRRRGAISDDPLVDVARLERGGCIEQMLWSTHRLEAPSFILPLVALTLLTPLSAHMLIGTTVLGLNLYSFNAWVLISLLLVGHAHITLLVLAVMHVLRVRAELDSRAPVQGAARGFWALLWTVAASSIPGAVLLCIPPMLVALTGLLFVPWMFHWASRCAQRERGDLEAMGLLSVDGI